jgi:hypothetical protein
MYFEMLYISIYIYIDITIYTYMHSIVVIPYDFVFILEIKAGDANIVYAMVMKVPHEYNIALAQLIGVCSDGASTSMGFIGASVHSWKEIFGKHTRQQYIILL